MLTIIFLIGVFSFILAYIFYGKYLSKVFKLDDSIKTPAHVVNDGIDYVPTNPLVLFGHHFSSIAGAGPVLGPIIAASAFGWLPALAWVILGAIFVGGVHDFSALVASIRHRARSIAEIAHDYMSRRAYLLFLAFVWLALVYVLTVFTDLTSATFVADPGVATSSIIYIILALLFGISIYIFRFPISISTIVFVSLVFASIWLGQLFPLNFLSPFILGNLNKTWSMLIVGYCFVASITPVWILLQPRDYLSSYLLYSSVIAGFLGILIGGFSVNFPAFRAVYSGGVGYIFPMLFITIACGAISGFHSIVSSGTTAKQLNKESDARPIGYGGMLVEGLVALIALSTLMIVPATASLLKRPPLEIYATGIGRFLSIFGFSPHFGYSFGLLALSTFILTTLDTATRLARYIFQEFFGLVDPKWRYLATIATLILPAIFLLITFTSPQGVAIPAWSVIWPVFGATNQLLGALALLVITLWLIEIDRPWIFAAIPMLFMIIITVTALTLLIFQYKFSIIGIIAIILFLLAILLIFEAIFALNRKWCLTKKYK